MPPTASRRPPPRVGPGFTLAEVVVALCVAGIVFGAFALVVARQERAFGDLARQIRARAQLEEGAAALAADLRSVSAVAGDIAPGAARDSAIELRATVGSAVLCAVEGRTLVTALASFVVPPAAGDTAWVYAVDSTPGTWIPLSIAGSTAAHPSSCESLAAAEGATSLMRRTKRVHYALVVAAGTEIPAGVDSVLTPMRVTRPVRYSLYRAPDAAWYLGRREWSAAQGRFASVQPVSGPYRAYAPPGADASGLELRYLDAGGVAIPIGSTETNRIARVLVVLRTPPAPARNHHRERDASTLAIGLRNVR